MLFKKKKADKQRQLFISDRSNIQQAMTDGRFEDALAIIESAHQRLLGDKSLPTVEKLNMLDEINMLTRILVRNACKTKGANQ